MKFLDDTQDFLKKAVPVFIFLALFSILFFPQDQTQYITIPIFIAVILAIIYFFIKK